MSNRKSRTFSPSIELPETKTLVVFCTASSFVYMYAFDVILGSGEELPTALQLILAFHYVGAIFGGLAFAASDRDRDKLLGLAVLLPGFIFSIFGAGRTVLVAHVTFWFAGYFSMLLFRRTRPVRLFSLGRTLAAAASLAVFGIVGIFVRPFRSIPRGVPIGERFSAYTEFINEKTLGDNWEFMRSGFFGHISAFSWYLEAAIAGRVPLEKGSRTLNGLYRLLGIEIAPEFHTDVGGLDTNVFTLFGPPMMDFGLIGSCVFFLMVGLGAGWSYRRLSEGTLWPAAILNSFYTNVTIAGGWFLSYNSITAAHILIGVYLAYAQRRLVRGTTTSPSAAPFPWRGSWSRGARISKQT